MFNLLPYASALDNVLLPLSFAPGRRARATLDRSAREEAERVLATLGIDSALATRGIAANLSVGQQQRVAAARALIGAPEIIIADEPTSALDAETQQRFLDLLFGQAEAAGATLLMVSHDERLAVRFDRAVPLHDVVAVAREAAA
jgi:putative ABC transport system ATP-binding protein